MAHAHPLRRQDLSQYEDLFEMFDEQMGFVPNSLLTLARRPEIFGGLGGPLRALGDDVGEHRRQGEKTTANDVS